jgi:hypothetical protein
MSEIFRDLLARAAWPPLAVPQSDGTIKLGAGRDRSRSASGGHMRGASNVPLRSQRILERQGGPACSQDSPHFSNWPKYIREERLLVQQLREALHQRAQPLFTHGGD